MFLSPPSKVFTEFGGYTAEGFARGVEDGSGRVNDAVDSMVAAPSKPAGRAVASVNKGGNTYVFHISGVKNAETLKEPSFLAKLTAALEGTAIAAGALLEPEAT